MQINNLRRVGLEARIGVEPTNKGFADPLPPAVNSSDCSTVRAGRRGSVHDWSTLRGLLYYGKAPGFADRLVYLPRLADKIAQLEILVEPVDIPLVYDLDRLPHRRNESAHHLQAKLSAYDWMAGITDDAETEARWIYGRADVVSRRLNASIEIGNCPADRILKAQKNGQRWLIVYPLYEDAEPVRFRFLLHGVVNARMEAAHAN